MHAARRQTTSRSAAEGARTGARRASCAPSGRAVAAAGHPGVAVGARDRIWSADIEGSFGSQPILGKPNPGYRTMEPGPAGAGGDGMT